MIKPRSITFVGVDLAELQEDAQVQRTDPDSAVTSSRQGVDDGAKLSQVDRQNFSPSALEQWDGKYHQLLYGLCADSNKAKDPEMRMRFFSLLFIMNLLRKRCSQDWESLSDVFWLKQGLDLRLAILVADLVIPLRELAHTDANVAYHLWVLAFHIVWVTLDKEEQEALAKLMRTLLSKDYHKKQQARRPNIVQALLEGLKLSHPQPRMPSEKLGPGFLLFSMVTDSMLKASFTKTWLRALRQLKSLTTTQCQRASRVFCLWKQADWAYLKDHVIPKAQVEETPDFVLFSMVTDSVLKASFTKTWLRQLKALATTQYQRASCVFGKSSGFIVLVNSVNGMCYETLGNLLRIMKSYWTTVFDLALEQWWQLPEMSVHARIPLLQQFQQLVEVQELARIIVDIANGHKLSGSSVGGVRGSIYADLKDILETWRLQTPNEWDNLIVWYDLLQWRNEMYNAVIDAFRDFGTTHPQLHHLGCHDKTWTVNKLAHISRRRAHWRPLINSANLEYFPVKHKGEIFRLKGDDFLLKMKRPLINGTNLDYFPVKHKAEIFRLKVLILPMKLWESVRLVSGPNTALGLALLDSTAITFLAEDRSSTGKLPLYTPSLADGNTSVASHSGGSLATGNQVHQRNQAGGVGSHDGGNSHVQEYLERLDHMMEGILRCKNLKDPQLVMAMCMLGATSHNKQSSSAINDGQNALRRNGALDSAHRNCVMVCYPSVRRDYWQLLMLCCTPVIKYKQNFERDLDHESTATFPATLSELTERFMHWKNVLQSNVEDRFPAVLKL
ncbi:phosphatidylinositol 3- and 4-kinase family protein with FAT domain-containing protein [Actinidia rufa]|uniref:Phosphatidylinositol 3-and 4-kinase family protein with FAT domain-containing protein n=1 Tax=Actinidia rufa TaxID=165716 RepID=A0A7J0DKR4_9ERIC|nr:phosphatidylinositol 3- and 4-kinase family protein with FAT domain-containing protein [Actinidia rufa]